MYSQQLGYTENHQWISFEKQYALMGITDFAQNELAGIIRVDMHHLNQTVKQGKYLGAIEAIKTVLDLFMPLTGLIVEINPEMLKNPGLINHDPYGAWMVRIAVDLTVHQGRLLTAGEYQAFIDQSPVKRQYYG